MNIRNIIFITIFLAVAIVQTNGQHVVRRLGALLEFGGNDRALLEVGGDDSSFSMMPVATDAAAGASGDMTMALVATDNDASASGGKRAMIKRDSTSKSSKGSTKSSKGLKGSKGSNECPEPEPTCAFQMFLEISSQHPVQIDKLGDNEFMIVWTGLTDQNIMFLRYGNLNMKFAM